MPHFGGENRESGEEAVEDAKLVSAKRKRDEGDEKDGNAKKRNKPIEPLTKDESLLKQACKCCEQEYDPSEFIKTGTKRGICTNCARLQAAERMRKLRNARKLLKVMEEVEEGKRKNSETM